MNRTESKVHPPVRTAPLPWGKLTLGVAAALVVGAIVHAICPPERAEPTPVPVVVPAPRPLPPYDPARAWERAKPHLDRTEAAASASIERQLQALNAFFEERSKGCRAFADDALSWGGKWAMVQGYLPFVGDEKGHEAFLQEAFARHILRPQELERLIASVLNGYASEMVGLENRLLVDLRADLGEDEVIRQALPNLDTEAMFRTEFKRVADQLVPALARQLGVSVGVFAASEVASQMLAQVMIAVATKLGVSGGILGAGAASGTVTFGVGLIVGVLVDYLVNWGMEATGCDAASVVAAKTREMLGAMREGIVEGSPAQWTRYRDARSPEERARVVASGGLGLRSELGRMHALRARLRGETVKAILAKGGTN